MAATAGSSAKRALLRRQHRPIVASSRDTTFADDLLMVRSMHMLPAAVCTYTFAVSSRHSVLCGTAMPKQPTLTWQTTTAAIRAQLVNVRAMLLRLCVCSRLVHLLSTCCVMHAQAGGADVVLNSLTSPGMVAASLVTLRPGGRFVEIGKRGIWGPAAVAAARPDVSYQLVAVDFLEPAAVGRAMAHVAADVAAGRLAPLPLVDYRLSRAPVAMRFMSQVSWGSDILL